VLVPHIPGNNIFALQSLSLSPSTTTHTLLLTTVTRFSFSSVSISHTVNYYETLFSSNANCFSISLVLCIWGMFVMWQRLCGYTVYKFSWTLVQLFGVVDIMVSCTGNWGLDICQSTFSLLYICTCRYHLVRDKKISFCKVTLIF
jgi:hypothetical protein